MPPLCGHRSFGPDNPSPLPVNKRQVQITTTITPTITRGGAEPSAITQAAPSSTQAAAPVQTLVPGTTRAAPSPEQVASGSTPALQLTGAPAPSTSIAPRPASAPAAAATSASAAAGGKDDDSIFPANLSWWQILGIALACVAVATLLAVIVLKKRRRNQEAKKKEKRANEEEKRLAQEEAARLREETLPHRLMGMGMGMGMGGAPVIWAGGGGGGGDRRNGGRGRGRGRGRRYSESDSDDSWESSGSESYDDLSDGGTIRKRRRRKPRRQKERSKKDRRRRKHQDQDSSDEDYTPVSAVSSFYARPSKSRSKEGRRGKSATPASGGQSGKRTSPRPDQGLPMGLGPPTSSAHTPDSGGSKSAGRQTGKRKTFRDSVFSTYDSMRRAAVRHKYMDGKVRMQKQLEEEERIERQRQAKIKEANDRLQREKDREERSLKQIAAMFAPAKQPHPEVPAPVPMAAPALPPTSESLHIPMPQPQPLTQPPVAKPMAVRPTRSVTRNNGSDIPTVRRHETLSPASAYESALPEKQHPRPPRRQSSELPYAYDGVTSVRSSGAPYNQPKAQPTKPKIRRQDSDPPLKSAMRTPGVRKPERKLTINDKTATIRPRMRGQISDTSTDSSVTGDFLSEWLSRPPAPGDKTRASRPPSPSTAKSVELSIPHPKDRPMIKRGGLAPAPPPRSRTDSSLSRSTLSHSTRSDISTEPLNPAGNGPIGNQPGNKWAGRLRDRR